MSFHFTGSGGDLAANHGEYLQQLGALLSGEEDWLANLANAASLLALQLDRINWTGFYLLRGEELVLGPFAGKPACTRIAIGRGVCGAAAQQRSTIVVTDVNQFPGHIACDDASRSEIVVPLLQDGRLVGVLDTDSPEVGRFGEAEQRYLEEVARLVAPWAAQACR
ncbi:MAG: GAF domain-containing protein [Mycobacterium leprae]